MRSTTRSRCYRISLQGAELLWSYEHIADAGSSPVVVDGCAFVQGEEHLACVDLETGKPRWQTTLDHVRRPQYTSPVAVDNKVILWDVATGEALAVHERAGAVAQVLAIAERNGLEASGAFSTGHPFVFGDVAHVPSPDRSLFRRSGSGTRTSRS